MDASPPPTHIPAATPCVSFDDDDLHLELLGGAFGDGDVDVGVGFGLCVPDDSLDAVMPYVSPHVDDCFLEPLPWLPPLPASFSGQDAGDATPEAKKKCAEASPAAPSTRASPATPMPAATQSPTSVMPALPAPSLDWLFAKNGVPAWRRRRQPSAVKRRCWSLKLPYLPPCAAGGGNHSGGHRRQRGQRRCSHCATADTPQWRAGPRGPGTLCNACGIRFKMNRLLPEYRPSTSPSFATAEHSNRHKNVLRIREKKVMQEEDTAPDEVVQVYIG